MTTKNVIDLHQQKIKKHIQHLMKEATADFLALSPTHGLQSTHVFEGWEHIVENWLILRFDKEVQKNADFVQITDLKYKFNELSINYISRFNIDYDDFIEQLASHRS
ncbi:hypothetical protein [Alteromonas sp. ASW11-130]|uniref:hypothetical protein n=1 Tax=Alteromonas sp. ASW11-130 TaxID=3015775 RepID=UPI0022418D79|nr:hypothetical protein [Alteromonas sp. ASW11-130]MCW8093399.1 hypothetical protein [Alteromonas sp. ASW11-130]